jgi:cell division protein ZapA (FtsZ GTPase activity inhibitor)
MTKAAVTINSRKYDVVADESVEYIEMLGTHINEKVDLVIRGGRNIMGERPIVLAALNICDEYFKSQESSRLIKEQLQINSEKLDALQNENKKLKADNKKLKNELEDATSDQISIDETEIKAETADAKKQLEEAGTQIKFLEGQIEILEGKLRQMEQDYTAREKEILEMIDDEKNN